MNDVVRLDPFNFVPITRTPWGGSAIPELKRRYFSAETLPARIGESWEVSTDSQFPSKVLGTEQTLTALLHENPHSLLGAEVAARFGAHSPLLLKWLQASQVLSVQVHPDNKNPLLSAKECGKPESWLVLEAHNGAFVYLGFQEGLTQEEILVHLKNDEPEKCLHKVFPKKFDYISVPTGCVHAVGPGVLVAEPQLVMPNRSGKTWRISDWKRKYDEKGAESENGKTRETHFEESLSAIDWTLPRGVQLEKLLISNCSHDTRFVGTERNPFAVHLFSKEGRFEYTPFTSDQFSLFTLWSGSAAFIGDGGKTTVLRGGESAFVPARSTKLKFELKCERGFEPAAAFFSLNLGVSSGICE